MTESRTVRPRVLLVSAGVGAGHNQAARALQAGLAQADPALEVRRLDALEIAPRLFSLYYAGGYNVLVTRLPRVYALGYRLTDRPRGQRRRVSERGRLWWERQMLRPFARWVGDRRPALVLNTHFVTAPVVAAMIARGAPGLRQMVVVTDNHAHRYWCSEHVDRYFVPDQASRERLIDFGVAGERIDVTGLPVHPKWHQPVDEAELRRRWNLPAGRPMVLVSGGVYFTVGGIDELAAQVCRRVPGAIVVVLAGENKRLLGRLARRGEARGDCPCLRAVSFTDRVHELVRLASICLTKSGGMTITESATAGAPAVLLRPVPGQETYNARVMVDAGAAVQAQTSEQAVELVAALLRDPDRLACLAANARRLARPSTDMICRRILDAVERFAQAAG